MQPGFNVGTLSQHTIDVYYEGHLADGEIMTYGSENDDPEFQLQAVFQATAFMHDCQLYTASSHFGETTGPITHKWNLGYRADVILNGAETPDYLQGLADDLEAKIKILGEVLRDNPDSLSFEQIENTKYTIELARRTSSKALELLMRS
jgi:hypothetical protein